MTHVAKFDQLDAATLHSILKLRIDVFVVEQACAYPELDGRDIEPDTRHVWITAGGDGEDVGEEAIAAYLRVLVDREAPLTLRIGRVVTHPDHRGQGMAAKLVQRVLGFEFDELVLDAQSHLADWYEAVGFAVTGHEFLEDGIPHVPMRLSLITSG